MQACARTSHGLASVQVAAPHWLWGQRCVLPHCTLGPGAPLSAAAASLPEPHWPRRRQSLTRGSRPWALGGPLGCRKQAGIPAEETPQPVSSSAGVFPGPHLCNWSTASCPLHGASCHRRSLPRGPGVGRWEPPDRSRQRAPGQPSLNLPLLPLPGSERLGCNTPFQIQMLAIPLRKDLWTSPMSSYGTPHVCPPPPHTHTPAPGSQSQQVQEKERRRKRSILEITGSRGSGNANAALPRLILSLSYSLTEGVEAGLRDYREAERCGSQPGSSASIPTWGAVAPHSRPPQSRPKASSQEEPNQTENHLLFDLKT